MPNGTLSRRVMMPPSNLGARASTATAWNSLSSPTACPEIEQFSKHPSLVVRCPADNEAVRRVTPIPLEPGQIRLEAARRDHDRPRRDLLPLTLALHHRRLELPVAYHQC